MPPTTMDADELNFREQLVRLDQMREETLKFIAEQHKLAAEREKLAAEARKFDRDRLLAPWLAIAGLVGGIVAVLTLVLHALRLA